MTKNAAIGHAIAVLRESAKQHRAAGDPAHGRADDYAADVLDATLTHEDREENYVYFSSLLDSLSVRI